MENREVVQLWDRSDSSTRPLRRPNTGSNVEIKTDNKEHKKSQLRADAEEWFPASYSFTTHTPQIDSIQVPPIIHSAQERLQKFKKTQENNVPPEGSYNDTELNEEKINLDTSRLNEIVKSLTYDPGQFDNVVETFMSVLLPYIDDCDVLSNAADMIFDQALCEPSFRYNAARLCSVIDEHCPLFRPRLHTLCEKELQANRHQQGLTLFLAELYTQLSYQNIYGRSLLASITNLINRGRPDDVKCICQTMKLAGRSLESYHKQDLDTIFMKLETLKPTLQSSSTISLLESVFMLRNNYWGHTTQSGLNNSFAQEQNGYGSSSSEDGFILYGPDGKEITSEEREFLRENFEDPTDFLGEESSDPDDLFDPEPEMDEEIQEAFREFVKLSKR